MPNIANISIKFSLALLRNGTSLTLVHSDCGKYRADVLTQLSLSEGIAQIKFRFLIRSLLDSCCSHGYRVVIQQPEKDPRQGQSLS